MRLPDEHNNDHHDGCFSLRLNRWSAAAGTQTLMSSAGPSLESTVQYTYQPHDVEVNVPISDSSSCSIR